MNVANAVLPTQAQAAEIFASPEDGPFVMVNLLKFKAKADYGDGKDSGLSGREAYERYSSKMSKLVEKAGGRVLYAGRVVRMMIGTCDPMWDVVGLVEYPSRKAFLSITQTPEFHEIERHRFAGLEGQLNIETKERPSSGDRL
jgi:uncharacterized protein (DUF1330 family)